MDHVSAGKNVRSVISNSRGTSGVPFRSRADQSYPQAGHVNHAITSELSAAAGTSTDWQSGHRIVTVVLRGSPAMHVGWATVVPRAIAAHARRQNRPAGASRGRFHIRPDQFAGPGVAVDMTNYRAKQTGPLVLFNRFFQPDIDIRTRTVSAQAELSTNAELLLRLRWAAILYGRVRPSLAVSGGVATPNDADREDPARTQRPFSAMRVAPEWPGDISQSRRFAP
jgi:hypothetical protein